MAAFLRYDLTDTISTRQPDEKSQLPWLQKEVHPFLVRTRKIVRWLCDYMGYSAVDATDTPGSLETKLDGSASIAITKTGADGAHQLEFSVDPTYAAALDDHKVLNDSADTAPGFLDGKVKATSSVVIATVTDAGVKKSQFSSPVEPISSTYDAGTSGANQTMTLTDAKGGGVVISGTDAGFTTGDIFKTVGDTNTVSVCNDGSRIEYSSEKIAIGTPTTSAAGARSIAVGKAAASTADYGIAIGAGAAATKSVTSSTSSIAIGQNASSLSWSTIAIGNVANAPLSGSVAVGHNARANGSESTAIGEDTICASTAGASDQVAVGKLASAAGDKSVAIGHSCSAAGIDSIALGAASSASGTAAIAVGKNASAGAHEASFGTQAEYLSVFGAKNNLITPYKLFEFTTSVGDGDPVLNLLRKTGPSSWEWVNIGSAVASWIGDVTTTVHGLMRAPSYGEMHEYDNGTALAIDTADTYHAFYTAAVHAGLLNGWTFSAGEGGTFTAIADLGVVGGVNQVRVTTGAAHTLVAGQTVNLTSSSVAGYLTQAADANHEDCFYMIKNVSDNTHFDIVSADLGTATGNWRKGAALVAGASAAGVYELTWSCTFQPAAANKLYKFEPRINVTPVDSIVEEEKPGASDPRPIGTSGYVDIAAGDRVILTCMNKTDTSNVTIIHSNIHVKRLY